MFDIVRNNRKIVQGLLVLIALSFAFVGMEAYLNDSGAGADLAKVGDTKITEQEFREALREQQDRMRQAARGQQIPQSMLDTPEIRKGVLESLINRRLLAAFAKESGIGVNDQQLAEFIASVPTLQVDGKFSPERYEQVVAAQNLPKEAFEARVRQDIILQQVATGLSASSFAGKTAAGLWQQALLEEREVASLELKPEQYVDQIKLADGAVKAYYDANRKDFELPQQVRAEFVVLSQADLLGQVSVSDAEIKSTYESRLDRYIDPEQRRASHILIQVDATAPADKIAAAKAKAEALLAQVKANPKSFAELAKKNSQDPVSAANGGDVDWFARDAMVKPFADAAFSLKQGSISDLVTSDYGFHIIQLTGIRPAKGKSLDDVRSEIEAELKQQAAAKKYAEAAEAFTNIVYEQADSLKPAAEKFKLEVRQSDWIAKGIAGNGLASNPKLLEALFSDDAITNKRNTEAVEVAPNTLVSARVLEAKPASVIPFDEVKDSITQRLMREEALKLATNDGEAKLAALARGEPLNLPWGGAQRIARATARELSREAVMAVFKAPATKLPAFAGAKSADGGYALYRITQVVPYAGGENPLAAQIVGNYQQLVASEEFAAWLGLLREKIGVEINDAALQKKE